MVKNRAQLITEYRRIPSIGDYYREKNPLWADNREAMRKSMEKGDLDNMLRWSTIQATMFTIDAAYLDIEYKALLEDDTARWMRAITESYIGNPYRYKSNEKVSGNLIHQAYHLMQFEKHTGQTIDKLDRIVEFGGGYGAMCVIARRLGFKGMYHIYDLPEFSLLQEYYLTQLGLSKDTYFHKIDDFGRFPAPPLFTDWLIGCHSLSEVEFRLRETFVSATSTKHILIALSVFWNTRESFENEFKHLQRVTKNYRWERHICESVTERSYLIGELSDN